jgi:hypothetical protein
VLGSFYENFDDQWPYLSHLLPNAIDK